MGTEPEAEQFYSDPSSNSKQRAHPKIAPICHLHILVFMYLFYWGCWGGLGIRLRKHIFTDKVRFRHSFTEFTFGNKIRFRNTRWRPLSGRQSWPRVERVLGRALLYSFQLDVRPRRPHRRHKPTRLNQAGRTRTDAAHKHYGSDARSHIPYCRGVSQY